MMDRATAIELFEKNIAYWEDEPIAKDVVAADRLAIAALREQEQSKWISVDEKLPEDGEYVLCWYEYFRYGDYNCMYQTYGIGYQFNGFWSGEVSNGTNCKVLAWTPLPEPPEDHFRGVTKMVGGDGHE